MIHRSWNLAWVVLAAVVVSAGCGGKATDTSGDGALTDAQVEDIVRRSYPYVALYNVVQKAALDESNPLSTGGFNKLFAATRLLDHNMKGIARPNNDSLYITCMLDLRKEPVVLDCPVFGSLYTSLMTAAYDHYVNVPLTTRTGDFMKPEKVLFYSERTEGYGGEPVEGVDRTFEMTGDFVIVVFRVMPHANEPEKYGQIVEVMKTVKMQTLSEFRGGTAKPIDDVDFPTFGKTDADVFGNNFVEVMQFVANHVSFDAEDELDQGVLAAWKLIGVEPRKSYEPAAATNIDGDRFRATAVKIQKENLAVLTNPQKMVNLAPLLLQPKGKTTLEAILMVSVIGPIGLPMIEAHYPVVSTADGEALSAQHDYVIRMAPDELPPSKAFWSLTLYDRQNGFFIPNDRKKYSVGLNGGMKLGEDGGIEIHVAAEKPDGVPVENWLPITRGDLDLDIILRVYVPDLEKLKTWNAPQAEKVAK